MLNITVDMGASTSAVQRVSWRSRRGAIVIVSALVLILSTLLPWVHAGLGTAPSLYRPVGLPPLFVGIVLVAVATIAGVLFDGVGLRDGRPTIGLAVPVFALLSSATLITVLETVATQLPMPSTVRRLGFQLSAGAGLWLAACALAVGVAAASGLTPRTAVTRLRQAGETGLGLRGASTVMIALAAVGLAVLRYQPWIEGSIAGSELDIQGWAVPWLGPLSLVLVWALALGAAAVLAGRPRAGALLAAATGWAVTFLAGLGIALGSQLGRTRVASVNLESLGIPESVDAKTAFALAPSVWAALALGWLAAAGGALALWSLVREAGDGH